MKRKNSKFQIDLASFKSMSSSSIAGWKEKIETLVERSGRKLLTLTQAGVEPNFGTVDFEK